MRTLDSETLYRLRLADCLDRLHTIGNALEALDDERIDHPYAWAVEALRDIADALEVPA